MKSVGGTAQKAWGAQVMLAHTTCCTQHTNKSPHRKQQDKNDTKRQESKHDQYQNSATPHKDRHHHKNDNEDTHQRQQNSTKPITTHKPMEPNPTITETSRGITLTHHLTQRNPKVIAHTWQPNK